MSLQTHREIDLADLSKAENKLITEQNAQDLSHAVGFRNIAVHQYENIDCNIVLSIINNHLEDFKEFAKAIGKLI